MEDAVREKDPPTLRVLIVDFAAILPTSNVRCFILNSIRLLSNVNCRKDPHACSIPIPGSVSRAFNTMQRLPVRNTHCLFDMRKLDSFFREAHRLSGTSTSK